jgi:UDP-N-acetylglucosamine--N-acetylmuramyl-(pentapeptide) pyrophosphoryl-undecaprenol N-acetylglucosamine transferase
MRVLFAGGGTGGHLFPAIAMAEEVVTRHPQNDVVFIGTNRGLEARVVPSNGFVFEAIPSRGLKGKGLIERLAGLAMLPLSLVRSFALLRKYAPDVVVGVGGYSSGPVVLAAWVMRIPTAIQEQNALPGLTNRILSKVVDKIFVSFEDAKTAFNNSKTQLLGNPIRRALTRSVLERPRASDQFRILVLGGSLGAKGLNDRVCAALEHLSHKKKSLFFTHQTGASQLDDVTSAYAAHHVAHRVTAFIDDMHEAYVEADLVVCRAGATTVAELTVCQKPSILVPYPLATDDHQAKNAAGLVKAQAALMFRETELDGVKLAQVIAALQDDRTRLRAMAKAAGHLGHPEAAREIVDDLAELAATRWGRSGRARSGPLLRAPVVVKESK